MIKGIKFASVPVTDQDRALEFYTKKLGLRILTDAPFNDDQRWIELGFPRAETKLVLFTAGGAPETDRRVSQHHVRLGRRGSNGEDPERQGRGIRAGAAEGRLGHRGDLPGSGRQQVRAVDAVRATLLPPFRSHRIPCRSGTAGTASAAGRSLTGHDGRHHLARGDRQDHPAPAAGGVGPIQLYRRPGAGHLRLRRLYVPNRRAVGIRPGAADVGCEGVPEPAADVRADHRDRLHRIVHRARRRAHRRSSP